MVPDGVTESIREVKSGVLSKFPVETIVYSRTHEVVQLGFREGEKLSVVDSSPFMADV